jgi:pilus assembly protein CpaE
MIAVIISSDAALRARLEAALEATTNADSMLVTHQYPCAQDMRALQDTNEKYVAFIDFRQDPSRAAALASEINISCPSVGVVGLNVGTSRADLIAIVRLGVCEVLPEPFLNQDVVTAYLNVTRKLASASGPSVRSGTVYAFLPAKPGAGASSLAVYSALACARIPESHPVLLDFDLRLGVSSFVLKLDSRNSIADAFENASRMDQSLWNQIVTERENLDVLGSAPMDFGKKVPLESFQSILKWARRQYAAVIVDLPGTMEDFEIATMHQAGKIFLVCSGDLTGLHMARQKVERLRSLQLLERVAVVMNRVDKRVGLPIRDIEAMLGLPILATVPTDERSIAEAVEGGRSVNPKSPLGMQLEVIARRMVESSPGSAQPRAKKRFIEYFSIAQAKGLDPWRL